MYGCELTNSNVKKVANDFEIKIQGKIYLTKILLLHQEVLLCQQLGGLIFPYN